MKSISHPARLGVGLIALLLTTGGVAAARHVAMGAPERGGMAPTAGSPVAVCAGEARIAGEAGKKGRDGAACSSSDECVNTCEGGSCCTGHEETCDASSHCCGHQSCTNGKCP